VSRKSQIQIAIDRLEDQITQKRSEIQALQVAVHALREQVSVKVQAALTADSGLLARSVRADADDARATPED
jgi:predicted  nucleic acid-binding Zn-ribbon protein